MTFPRLLGTHHHSVESIPGLEDFVQEAIDASGGGTGPPAGGGEAGPSPWPVLESLTGQTDGAAQTFPTSNLFVLGSTRVFAEGLLLEPEIDWIEDTLGRFVYLSFAPPAGTQLAVEYLAAVL